MGTRGFYIYRFRGRYYTMYNYLNSYPIGLGSSLLAFIPEDPEKYQRMLGQCFARKP